MRHLIDKLYDLHNQLLHSGENDVEVLINVKDKTRLYLQKFFKSPDYLERLEKIDVEPDPHDFVQNFITSKNQLKSLISTLIEEIELQSIAPDPQHLALNESIKRIEEEKKSILKLKNEIDKKNAIIEAERNNIENERAQLISQNEEFKKLQSDFQSERERLLETTVLLNEVNKKLEITDKTVDFQEIGKGNRQTAYWWAAIASILIIIILIILNDSLSDTDTFSNLANTIYKTSKNLGNNFNIDKTKPTSSPHINNDPILYFTFIKYCLTKILLYTILIYAIILCVKNYNAQMHNYIINTHKSNALKSTLNLLNTARSDDGNDKLLIQATQAIFTHQNNGYNGVDSEPPSPNLVTNVIDAASKKLG